MSGPIVELRLTPEPITSHVELVRTARCLETLLDRVCTLTAGTGVDDLVTLAAAARSLAHEIGRTADPEMGNVNHPM
jgi:hypothetical protein